MNKYLDLIVEVVNLYDIYNADHARKVKFFSVKLAEKMNLKKERIELIAKGALIHDIGKLLLPHDILNKPGILDIEEKKIIERHSIIGANLVKKVGLEQEIQEIVRYHHERCDGKGYPDRLKGEEIPLAASVVSLSEYYYTAVSDNFIAGNQSKEETIVKINELRGKKFDPDIVDIFIDLVQTII